MENISDHITYLEGTKSNTAAAKGFDNTPNAQQLSAMKVVATKIFEPLRKIIGKPLLVSSFFRSDLTNKAVGGSNTSQHLKGQAIDIKGIGFTNAELFLTVLNSNLPYDQLIWEFGNDTEPRWVHISYNNTISDGQQRKQILHIGTNGTKALTLAEAMKLAN